MPFILTKTISENFLERVKATPDQIGFQYKIDSEWKTVTFRQFHDECRLVSFGLMGLEIKKGDKVALLSGTRYEWNLFDLAILGCGAVTVPIYPSNTAEDVEYILNHSESTAVVLEDAKQLEKVLARREKLKFLKTIVVIDPAAMASAKKAPDVMTVAAVKEIGKRQEARNPIQFEKNLRDAKPEDLITICYTSGTTGVPKGVMLSHDNFVSVMEDGVAYLRKYIKPETDTTLSFLPYSHVLGKCESLLIWTFGWRCAYAESYEKLATNMQEVHPTLIFAVPRIFEKAYTKIASTVAESSTAKKILFDWATLVGRSYYDSVWSRERPTLKDFVQYQVARELIFKKIREGFGGRLRYAICGGAPLPQAIGEFFYISGIRILEGYGLTETSAPVTLNSPTTPRFGTVGKPLPEVSIKIAEDGEILIKSRKVFQGYYKMPEETAQALRNGWFHTEDIGQIEEDGVLKITDRKKDIIVTSAGKNVAPQKIENMAKAHKLISQFVVHGDQRNYLTALVTLDQEQVIRIAAENQILFSAYSELIKNPKILAMIQKIIDEVNQHLASYETIKKFIILPNEFTVDGGELTPSLKVRRKVIGQRYRAELDSMYI